jgi:hypothetical protein
LTASDIIRKKNDNQVLHRARAADVEKLPCPLDNRFLTIRLRFVVSGMDGTAAKALPAAIHFSACRACFDSF